MSNQEDILAQVRAIIVAQGEAWADNYELFLADNRTFDGYWPDGVDAIRDNTVHDLVFGSECMVATASEYDPLPSPDDWENAHLFLMDLAIAMDRAVAALVKGKAPGGPN